MTREECKKILAAIMVTYPNFKVVNVEETLNLWELLLNEYDYKTIEAGLLIYIKSSGSAFAPSVSELIAMTRKPQELTMVSEVDVWREVRPAIRNSGYHAEEEFNKLSETAKKMVGDPQQLREWAMLPSEDIDTVVQSNFKSRFKTMQARQAEISAMPMEIRQMIESNVKQIGVNNG